MDDEPITIEYPNQRSKPEENIFPMVITTGDNETVANVKEGLEKSNTIILTFIVNRPLGGTLVITLKGFNDEVSVTKTYETKQDDKVSIKCVCIICMFMCTLCRQ